MSSTAPLLNVTLRINVNKFIHSQQCHQKINILNFVKVKSMTKLLYWVLVTCFYNTSAQRSTGWRTIGKVS